MREVVAVDQLDEAAPRRKSRQTEFRTKAAQEPIPRHGGIMSEASPRSVGLRGGSRVAAGAGRTAAASCLRAAEIAGPEPELNEPPRRPGVRPVRAARRSGGCCSIQRSHAPLRRRGRPRRGRDRRTRDPSRQTRDPSRPTCRPSRWRARYCSDALLPRLRACSPMAPRSSAPAFGASSIPRPAPSTVPVRRPIMKPPPPSCSKRS